MKKSTKILLCLSTAFIALGVILMVESLVFGVDPVYAFQSGMFNFQVQQKRSSEFSVDGQYSVPVDGITELSIDWLDGKVEVEVYDGSEIILKETSNSALNESNSLMYTRKNNTLEIVSGPSQVGLSLSEIGYNMKELHVYLPANIQWKGIQMDVQDADVSINSMDIQDFKMDVVDGDLFFSKVKLENLSFSSVEGNLIAEDSQLEKVNMDTVSGGITASLINCPQSIWFDTISGDTKLYLPNESEFMLQMDTVSGTMDTDFVGTHSEENFTVGNGSAQFNVSTSDGAVQILKNEEK